MGSGHHTQRTTITKNLSDEAKAMIASQYATYLNSAGTMDNILNSYNNANSNSTNYDWNNIENNYLGNMNNLTKQYQGLANGNVSDDFTNNMGNYYNQVYDNTLGKSMNSLGARGVLNSSITNESISDMQKNLAAQESKDYTNYLNTESSALNNLGTSYKDMYNSYATSQSNDNSDITDLLNQYATLYGLGNSTLGTIGNLTDSTTQTTTSSGGSFLGTLLSAVATGYGAKL